MIFFKLKNICIYNFNGIIKYKVCGEDEVKIKLCQFEWLFKLKKTFRLNISFSSNVSYYLTDIKGHAKNVQKQNHLVITGRFRDHFELHSHDNILTKYFRKIVQKTAHIDYYFDHAFQDYNRLIIR